MLRQPSLGIAVRRVCSALGARQDDRDQLVDLVIAWESIFGGQPAEGEPRPKKKETVTARVASSLAAAVGVDTELDRQLIDLEARRIMRLRGRVVHGGGSGLQDDSVAFGIEVAAAVTTAADYALKALHLVASDPRLRACRNALERADEIRSRATQKS